MFTYIYIQQQLTIVWNSKIKANRIANARVKWDGSRLHKLFRDFNTKHILVYMYRENIVEQHNSMYIYIYRNHYILFI